MKTSKLAIALVMTFLCCFSFTSNAASKEYENAVAKYLEVTNAREPAALILEQMYSNMGIQTPKMHDMCVEIMDAIWPEYLVLMSDVMSRYLSMDDLNDVIAFYQTPSGAKFGKYIPIITQEYTQEYTQLLSNEKFMSKIINVIQKYMQ